MNPDSLPHVAVVDLGFGDAGKGTTVDWLCAPDDGRPRVDVVVRFNGGAQAGHNVVTPDGRHHTFAQFGAGTFHGVPTHLSRLVLVDPLALAVEAEHLAALGVPDPFGLVTVDRDALVVTPYHRAANRIRERARGERRHGSCGMGVGEAAAAALAHPEDAPTVGDCARPAVLRRKLVRLRERLEAELGPLGHPPPGQGSDDPRLLRDGRAVFEGAQGVLLDEHHGFHPHTTWSTTTFTGVDQLLTAAGVPGSALRLGVVRTHTTRHGTGPLVTQDSALTGALPDPHNRTGPWQGAFRIGHFDAVAHRYALEVTGGVDALVLTHLDSAAAHPELRVATAYRMDGRDMTRLEPLPPDDLARRAERTRQLGNATAVLSAPLPADRNTRRWDRETTPPADLRPRPVPAARAVPEARVAPPAPGVPAARAVPADWEATVTDALGAPVALASRGPTLLDKETLGPLLAARSAPMPCRQA